MQITKNDKTMNNLVLNCNDQVILVFETYLLVLRVSAVCTLFLTVLNSLSVFKLR
jgi:hypothetical protein